MNQIVAREMTNEAPAPRGAAGLSLRLFEAGDSPGISLIMRQHHANTLFRHQPFSQRKLETHFRTILTRPPGIVCITAEWNGEAVGVVWAVADSYMLSDGPPFVSVHVLAIDLDLAPIRRAKVFLGLVSAVKQWAKIMNASHSFIHGRPAPI